MAPLPYQCSRTREKLAAVFIMLSWRLAAWLCVLLKYNNYFSFNDSIVLTWLLPLRLGEVRVWSVASGELSNSWLGC